MTLFLELQAAVEAQPGICAGVPMNADGELDTIGAYAYHFNVKVRAKVDAYRDCSPSSPREGLDRVAEICDDIICHTLPIFGPVLLRRIYQYNDGQSFYPGETLLQNETSAQRRIRMACAFETGALPEDTYGSPV